MHRAGAGILTKKTGGPRAACFMLLYGVVLLTEHHAGVLFLELVELLDFGIQIRKRL